MRYGRFIPPKLPKPGEALPAGAIDIQEDRFHLYEEGNWTNIVADDGASNGKAARMSGGHTNWAVQFSIPKDDKQFGKGPWRVYFVVRTKLNRKGGEAFRYGMFDNNTGTHMALESVGMEMAGDEKYHAYGLKFPELKSGMYFWISPPGHTGVEAVYIERISCVKDKQ
jgi:uncharacterized protein involved in high-affinity Fe2+ transport